MTPTGVTKDGIGTQSFRLVSVWCCLGILPAMSLQRMTHLVGSQLSSHSLRQLPSLLLPLSRFFAFGGSKCQTPLCSEDQDHRPSHESPFGGR